MGKLLLISSFILTFLFNYNNEDKLKGEWFAKDLDNSTIIFFKDGNGFWNGKIIKSDNPKYVGRFPILNFKYNETIKTYYGTIISLAIDKEIDGTITLTDDKTMLIKGKMLFITKQFVLSKLK